MYLAYINELGCDWKDENHYEFLFVDDAAGFCVNLINTKKIKLKNKITL